MAIAQAEVKTHSRKLGHSAVAASAYRTRSRLVDERTGEVLDYRHRAEDLEHTQIVLPEAARAWMDARRDAGMKTGAIRSELWNGAEAMELAGNARVCREMTVPMPWELTKAQRVRVSYEIAKFITDQHEFTFYRRWMENRKNLSEIVPMKGHGVAVEFSMHYPDEDGSELNYHTHFQLSTRRMNENGYWEKSAELDSEKTSGVHIEAWRHHTEVVINRALARAGYDKSHFIDMRSYERQGLNREGQIHVGPKARVRTKRGHEQSDVEDYNRAVRERNAAIAREEKRAGLNDKSNVIDFEEKLAQREGSREEDILRRHAHLRDGVLRKSLQRLRAREIEITMRREAREAVMRAFTDAVHPVPEAEVDAARPFNDAVRSVAHGGERGVAEDERHVDDDIHIDRETYETDWQKSIVDGAIEEEVDAQRRRDEAGEQFREHWKELEQEQVQALKDIRSRAYREELAQSAQARQDEGDALHNEAMAALQNLHHDERIAQDRVHDRERTLHDERMDTLYDVSEEQSRIKELEERLDAPQIRKRGREVDQIEAWQSDVDQLRALRRNVAHAQGLRDGYTLILETRQQSERQILEHAQAVDRAVSRDEILGWYLDPARNTRGRVVPPEEATRRPESEHRIGDRDGVSHDGESTEPQSRAERYAQKREAQLERREQQRGRRGPEPGPRPRGKGRRL